MEIPEDELIFPNERIINPLLEISASYLYSMAKGNREVCQALYSLWGGALHLERQEREKNGRPPKYNIPPIIGITRLLEEEKLPREPKTPWETPPSSLQFPPDSFKNNPRIKSLFKSFDQIAKEKKLNPEIVAAIANLISDLFYVTKLREEGKLPKNNGTVLDEAMENNFKYGDFEAFAKFMEKAFANLGEKPEFTPPHLKDVDSLKKAIKTRKTEARCLLPLILERYLTEDNQGRCVVLFSLASGFLSLEDIRIKINPSLKPLGRVYNPQEALTILRTAKEILRESQFGIQN